MPYSQTVLEHFERPRNAGPYAGPPAERIGGGAGSRRAGVELEFDLQVHAGRIVRGWFRAYGCPHTIAAASWATEWLAGRPVEALEQLRAGRLAEALELPPEKLGRVLVVEDALIACLAGWRALHHG